MENQNKMEKWKSHTLHGKWKENMKGERMRIYGVCIHPISDFLKKNFKKKPALTIEIKGIS